MTENTVSTFKKEARVYKFTTKEIKLEKDGNLKHKKIMRYFPFTGEVIYREEEDQVIILSPEFPKIDIKASMVTVPTYPEAKELHFKARMYAFTRQSKTHKMIPITQTAKLASWFISKAQKNGFEVTKWKMIQPLGPVFCNKNGNRFPKNSVEFQGLLKVTDKDLFNKTVTTGLGQGKAYGFALLDVSE